MPNWCENKLTIRGKNGVLGCLAAIKGEPDEDGPRHIDFQKIVPMPAILLGTVAGSTTGMGRVLLGDDVEGNEMLLHAWVREKGITDLEGLCEYIRENHPEAEAEGRHSMQAEQETGSRDWYEWRTRHWGTKWNASYFSPLGDVTDQRADLEFCTAWSPPLAVIVELSQQFPQLSLTLKFWEGGNGFRGILRTKAGRILKAANYDYKGHRGG